MNTNAPISENTADALYDAATAQYALHTLEQLRREYDLASPNEQEAINNLIERGAQIVFNSDLPEAYVTVDQWTQIRPHKWGIGDWAYAIREIFIEDDHYVSSRAFAGACHFNGPIAYQTFYPLNPTDEQLAEARDKAERYTAKAAALLASGNRSVPAYAETPDMHILFGGVDKSAAANVQQLAAITEAAIKGVDLVTVDIEQDLNNLRDTYNENNTECGEKETSDGYKTASCERVFNIGPIFDLCRHIETANFSDYRVNDRLFSIFDRETKEHAIYVDGEKVASIQYRLISPLTFVIKSQAWAINAHITELDNIHRYFGDGREDELNDLRRRCELLGSGVATSTYNL